MKKSIKATVAALGMVAMTVAVVPNAQALSWTLSPDANTLAFGVTVVAGLNQVNFADSASQPPGIYGAGFTISATRFLSLIPCSTRSPTCARAP